MKIGVLTFWNGNSNYGQIFQCWALQQYLKQKGHDPFVIKYIPTVYAPPLKRFLKKVLFIKEFRLLKTYLFNNKKYKTRCRNASNDIKRNFDEFRNLHLRFSDLTYHNIRQLQLNPPNAELYIVGSDQVWAQILNNRNNRAFFLDFGKSETKRIAYAPSFVVNEYPAAYRDDLKQLLKRFNAVSVREYSGVDICKSVGIEATKVLDPTFLLERKDYLSLISEPIKKKKQIFIYSLNISSSEQIRWEELKKDAKEKDLKIIVTPSKGYFDANELFGSEVEYLYATPQQWLKTIAESEFVVTPSFHGVAISIILGTPFVYVPLKGKFESGNARIIDLLSDLSLNNRIISDNQPYDSIISNYIDWEFVSKALKLYKKASYDYLCQCGI